MKTERERGREKEEEKKIEFIKLLISAIGKMEFILEKIFFFFVKLISIGNNKLLELRY